MKMLSMKEYEKWCKSSFVDEETKKELISISTDEKEIEERFYRNLEFGTAGLRGIIGAGTNRMNVYTVRKATQGLAMYINDCGSEAAKRGVVISYDSRLYSDLFALEAAKVLAGNGIKAYLFDRLNPVPTLSFAVRHLNCIAGIMITASHNPAKYNGYKVYWEDGAQMPPLYADKVLSYIESIDIFEDIKIMDKVEAVTQDLLVKIGEQVETAYLNEVVKQSTGNNNIISLGDKLHVVYTPFHGAGNIPVRKILKMIGIDNVHVVKEQEEPDPQFSTVKSPNPENPEGFVYAEKLAYDLDASFIIGTDPDCDRVGVMVKNPDGKFIPLTGNQIGSLLMDFVANQRTADNTMPKNPIAVKTIVSTPMAEKIANNYGIEMKNVLTGFKYIGEIIKNLEEKGEEDRYILGFEESYGYLAGTYARDKDAVVASMLISEMAAYYAVKGMTLYDAMQALYEKYGYFREVQKSITLEGIDGIERIKGFMKHLKENPIAETDGKKVVSFSDYSKSEKINALTGEKETINLPKADVLEYVLEDGRRFIIRPSGTEPKIKFYFFVEGKTNEDAENLMNSLMKAVDKIAEKSL